MSWLRKFAPLIAALVCLLFVVGSTGCKTMEKQRRDLDSSDDEENMPADPTEGPDRRPPPT